MRPEATRKLVHPVEHDSKASERRGGAPSLEPMAVETAVQTPQGVDGVAPILWTGLTPPLALV